MSRKLNSKSNIWRRDDIYLEKIRKMELEYKLDINRKDAQENFLKKYHLYRRRGIIISRNSISIFGDHSIEILNRILNISSEGQSSSSNDRDGRTVPSEDSTCRESSRKVPTPGIFTPSVRMAIYEPLDPSDCPTFNETQSEIIASLRARLLGPGRPSASSQIIEKLKAQREQYNSRPLPVVSSSTSPSTSSAQNSNTSPPSMSRKRKRVDSSDDDFEPSEDEEELEEEDEGEDEVGGDEVGGGEDEVGGDEVELGGVEVGGVEEQVGGEIEVAEEVEGGDAEEVPEFVPPFRVRNAERSPDMLNCDLKVRKEFIKSLKADEKRFLDEAVNEIVGVYHKNMVRNVGTPKATSRADKTRRKKNNLASRICRAKAKVVARMIVAQTTTGSVFYSKDNENSSDEL